MSTNNTEQLTGITVVYVYDIVPTVNSISGQMYADKRLISVKLFTSQFVADSYVYQMKKLNDWDDDHFWVRSAYDMYSDSARDYMELLDEVGSRNK